jgi:hypothetical protein
MQTCEHVVTVQNNKITYIWVLNNCLILSFSMNNSQVKRKLHFENDKDKIQEDSTLELINSEKRKKTRYFEHFIRSAFETATKFNMPYIQPFGRKRWK